MGQSRAGWALGVGFVLAFVALLVADPIGRRFVACSALFGCSVTALFYAGIPIGLAAVLAVRRWRELGAYVTGLWAACVVAGLVGLPPMDSAVRRGDVAAVIGAAPAAVGLIVGALGAPTFLVGTLVRVASGGRGNDRPN